ncbi:lysis system i-spanin subunit Rz [Enterobacter sp. 22466]|uniref:lysis system i-spanin subunit Rz n=1 Tax=Enterobacter sp. 22466 TaxID=3453924 RepID=UPI003F8409C1
MMLPSLRLLWWGGLCAAFITSITCASHYHRRWQETCRAQDDLQQRLRQTSRQLQLQQEQQLKVAALDQQLTGELTHEKNHITLLEQRIRSGQRRLQLHARCTDGAENAATSGLAHAPPPDLLTPLSGIISVSDAESP